MKQNLGSSVCAGWAREGYVFWDGVHPTTDYHYALGQYVYFEFMDNQKRSWTNKRFSKTELL